MAKKLFVTGTGTDVGKTYVTGLILKKLHQSGETAAYYKAVSYTHLDVYKRQARRPDRLPK